jgi:hypothetical protein
MITREEAEGRLQVQHGLDWVETGAICSACHECCDGHYDVTVEIYCTRISMCLCPRCIAIMHLRCQAEAQDRDAPAHPIPDRALPAGCHIYSEPGS